MGNLEKTQRPLPMTPLQEGRSTVRTRGPPHLCLPPVLSQGGSLRAWIPVRYREHPNPQAWDGRGDLQHPHQSLHMASTEDRAQPCHHPSPATTPGTAPGGRSGGWSDSLYLRK